MGVFSKSPSGSGQKTSRNLIFKFQAFSLTKYCLLICALFLINCKNKVARVVDKNLPFYQLALKDSFDIHAAGPWKLVTRDHDRYLLLNRFTDEALVTDLYGTKTISFYPLGKGEGKFGKYIYGLNFFKKGFIVLSTAGIAVLDDKGQITSKFLQKNLSYSDGNYNFLKIDRDGKSYFIGNAHPLFATSDSNNTASPTYYKTVKNYTIFNEQAKTFSYAIPYEKASLYLNNDYYYDANQGHIAINGSNIFVIYDLDPTIYKYQLTTGGAITLLEKIKALPQNFEVGEGVRFGKLDPEASLKKQLHYSNFLSVFSFDDHLITQYNAGVSEDSLKSPITIQDAMSLVKTEDVYCQVFYREKRASNDILLPKNKVIEICTNKDSLILSDRSGMHPGRFYRYSLVIK